MLLFDVDYIDINTGYICILFMRNFLRKPFILSKQT